MIYHKVTCFLLLVCIKYGYGQAEPKQLIDLNRYHSYETILQYIEDLANEDKERLRVHRIGRTYEGRDLVLVRASSDFLANKPVIMVDAGAHAREWASLTGTLSLLENIRLNISGLLEYADWHIIPLVNPDGYEYTRNHDRLWRKNRVPHGNSGCRGTDLNRNYNFHWGVTGVDHDPCSYELYPGPHPLSEVETKAVAGVMMKYSSRTVLYLTLHAFGNYMVYPYGYTGDILPPDWRRLDLFARNVTGEIGKFNGEQFKVMSAGQWYPGAGGSDDYAYGVVGIPYSFTVELTKDNFLYPENKLGDLVEEMHVMFKAIGKLIHQEFGRVAYRKNN